MQQKDRNTKPRVAEIILGLIATGLTIYLVTPIDIQISDFQFLLKLARFPAA